MAAALVDHLVDFGARPRATGRLSVPVPPYKCPLKSGYRFNQFFSKTKTKTEPHPTSAKRQAPSAECRVPGSRPGKPGKPPQIC